MGEGARGERGVCGENNMGLPAAVLLALVEGWWVKEGGPKGRSLPLFLRSVGWGRAVGVGYKSGLACSRG